MAFEPAELELAKLLEHVGPTHFPCPWGCGKVQHPSSVNHHRQHCSGWKAMKAKVKATNEVRDQRLPE